MALIKCKMCGGDLELLPDSTVCQCEYCGTKQTIPSADSEKKLQQFERADRLRRGCEFDKAAGVYEAIVSEFPREAEAYWGLVLCKYGIEYVDDPATGKKIPTCHRSSFDSVLDDGNFELTMENSDPVSLQVYRQEAKQIETIRRGILEVSAKEEPYDIFICYKETDDKGERTVDSLLAQTIHDALTEKGYRVFFSRITLEDKLGVAYEPYIFAALNSAKLMLAVGTKYEYYNAVWVKNEWSRFLKLMGSDKTRSLIPCYKDIDGYDIPREFAHLQGQDMGKVGAMQDLLRGVEKILPRQKAQPENSANAEQTALLDRAKLFLEDARWAEADSYCEKVLDRDPRNSMAYLVKLLAALRVKSLKALDRLDISYGNHEYYQKALRFADEQTRNALENHRKEETYRRAKGLLTNRVNTDILNKAATMLQSIADYKDAAQIAAKCREQVRELDIRRQRLQLEAELCEAQSQGIGGETILVCVVCGVVALVFWFVASVAASTGIRSGVCTFFVLLGVALVCLGLTAVCLALNRRKKRIEEVEKQINALEQVG